MLLSFQPGNTVSFIAYRGEPIRWKAAEQYGKMRMLIAVDIVYEMPYNELRRCILTDHDAAKMAVPRFPAGNPDGCAAAVGDHHPPTNEPNEQFFTNVGLVMMDKMFILSKRELDIYLPEAQDWTLANGGVVENARR